MNYLNSFFLILLTYVTPNIENIYFLLWHKLFFAYKKMKNTHEYVTLIVCNQETNNGNNLKSMKISLNSFIQRAVIIILFIIYFPWLAVQGQGIEPLTINFIPPSPTAYELGRYGQIPVGMFTGTPNVNIPLYTYKTNNLSVPISLRYNSNGIKVDQMATWVGLGWSLQAGGVITRIIRDLPDELYSGPNIPKTEITLSNHYNIEVLEFFEDAGELVVDTERDLFMFNFNGYSGKFVIDKYGKIVIMPNQNLSIRGSYHTYSSHDSAGFEIITPDGVRYLFADAESSYLTGSCTSDNIDSRNKKTAWYLSGMVHPGGDTIRFIYEHERYHFPQGISESKTTLKSVIGQGCLGDGPQCSEGSFNKCNPELHVNGLRLKEIRSNNPTRGKIVFSANTPNTEVTEVDSGDEIFNFLDIMSVRDKEDNEKARFSFQYSQTSNDRTFLKSITFLDDSKKYQFGYYSPSGLPTRLSYSQDYWGYYNGIFNTVFYPRVVNDSYFPDGANRNPVGSVAKAGLLRIITYPTGGTTELKYEPNYIYKKSHKYSAVHVPEITLDEGSSLTIKTTFKVASENLSFGLSPYESNIYLRLNEAAIDPCESELDLWITARILDKSTTPNTYLLMNGSTILKVSTLNEPAEAVVMFKPGHEYEVQLEKSQSCLWGAASISYFTYKESTTNIETGGLRVSKTIDITGSKDTADIKKYYYGSMKNVTVSSADPGEKEFFITDAVTELLCNNGNPLYCVQCEYKQISSNSLIPLFNTGNNNVYYGYVTISYGGDSFENGGEEHKFIINRDQSGEVVKSFYAHVPENRSYSNTGWDHGLEVSVKTFRKEDAGNFAVVREVFNHYKKDERYYNEVINYNVIKKFEPMCSRPPLYYTCNEEDIDSYWISEICTANHTHQWTAPLLSPGSVEVCFAAGNENRFSIKKRVDPQIFRGLVHYFDVHCDASHEHQTENLDKAMILNGYCCDAPGNDHLITINYSRCYHKNIGDTIYSLYSLDHINVIKYKDLSYWHYMDSTSTTQYDQNGKNPVTTFVNFYYDNPGHLLLTRQITKDSEGKLLETKLSYPMDYDPLSRSTVLDTLISRHIINPVIEQIKIVDGKIVSAQAIEYKHKTGDGKNYIVPGHHFSLEIINPMDTVNFIESTDGTTFTSYIKQASYNDYDDNGNILEFSKENDIHTAFIWSYNGTYPVVKGENIDHATLNKAVKAAVASLSGNYQDLNDLMDAMTGEMNGGPSNLRHIWKDFNESLRNNTSLADAMIITFTYDPLIGMTSQTDPVGKTAYFEYDDFGRLESVKDSDEEIVKTYEYNYRIVPEL